MVSLEAVHGELEGICAVHVVSLEAVHGELEGACVCCTCGAV